MLFPPEILTLFPGEFRSLAMGFGGIPPGPSSRRIWSALRAVFAFECPRPPLRDFTIEMGEAAQSRKPSGTFIGAGGFSALCGFPHFYGEVSERRPWAFKREDRPKGAPNSPAAWSRRDTAEAHSQTAKLARK